MSSERTAVDTNTVTDTPEQKNLPETPVDGKGERIGIVRESQNIKVYRKTGRPYHRAGSERLLEILKQYCWR
jgi:hypothetical protein